MKKNKSVIKNYIYIPQKVVISDKKRTIRDCTFSDIPIHPQFLEIGKNIWDNSINVSFTD